MRLRGALSKLMFLAVSIAAAWLAGGAALAHAGEGRTQPRFAQVFYTDRVADIAVDYWNDTADATAKSLVLLTGGVEVGRIDVSTEDAAGAAVFRVRIDADQAALTAAFVDEGGVSTAQSPPLTFNAAQHVPPPPRLSLKQNRVIGKVLKAVGSANAKTTSVEASLRERAAATVTLAGGGRFTLPNIKLPRGDSDLTVTASNAWGRSSRVKYRVWNLGQTPRKRTYILIDKSEFRLYWVKGRVVRSVNPVAIGTPVTPTPTGTFVLGGKQRMKRSSPWGVLRMRLVKKTRHGKRATSYYIHGTNNPYSIGTYASHGCIRMFNGDVRKLSRQAARGTTVRIRR